MCFQPTDKLGAVADVSPHGFICCLPINRYLLIVYIPPEDVPLVELVYLV